MSRVDRRTFLRDLALASAAAAGTAVAPGILGAAAEPPANGVPVWKKAPCNLCGIGCGFLVAIDRGRAVAMKGDPESSVNRGLGCVKGYHAVQALYAEDRLTRAMVRRNGVLVPVPLGEALDVVAGALRGTIDTHGADAVGLLGPAGWNLTDALIASALFGEAIGTRNIDSSERLESGSASAGLETTFGVAGAPGCYEDFDEADVFVLWNGNVAETDPVLFSRMLERRRRNPAVRIIDLSTRTTRTSYAADQSLRHAPHTEIAIANAIGHEIVARRRVDRDFVDRYVAFKRGRTGIGNGLDDQAVIDDDGSAANIDEYVKFLADYTPEAAARISGLAADRIRWLASLYAEPGRRVMSVGGAAMNADVRGTWMNNALANIHLLVGKVATPGNGVFCMTGTTGTGLPPAGRVEAARRGNAVAMFRALDRGALRFLWIQSANPMLALPNIARYREGAGQAGRFVVVSSAYPTATTRIAHVVLPASLWIEQERITHGTGRRLQHHEAMVRPPGDATSEGRQMMEVARRLGLTDSLKWAAGNDPAEIWEELRRRRSSRRDALPALAELRDRPGVLWPSVAGRETKRRFSTAEDPAADRTRGEFDFYGHADHRAWIWLRPYEPAAEPPDAAFPFWLETGAVLEHSETGWSTRRIPVLHRAAPRAYVELNAGDAKRLGIRNRETVRLVSRRGSMLIEARIDYRSQPEPGAVFVPTFDEAHAVNTLMADAHCPLSGQPDSKCAVRIERVGSGGAS